ncbi:hypothetical protein SASPL_109722 [Salvia splendens]|uniref:FLZ-type domain-containing protein n=1 Tax=Salvia splendens TaxID=180675 RepID=A0A8X8YKK8_SALSN|nr:FCS-Like Zinc finger 13-like [Salvia splendens]KAG6431641.1 hypothetical protein SASPL_109722 [Salvia splendens]
MLGKTSKPVIEILTGSFSSGAGSPRTQIQSPRGLKSLDLGAVGLGIVAALEKSGGSRDGIPALFSRNFTRSSPIPVNSPINCCRRREAEEDSSEEYTIVTCHGGNKPYTKVYSAEGARKGDGRSPFRIQSGKMSNRAAVFHISPARGAEAGGAPTPDFLNSCDLCRKKLHGKDIYMYRGEKAFCSADCRYTQMVMDERKEKCSAEASAAAEVVGSPYANRQMFTAGILAV